MVEVIVHTGSNLGNRFANLEKANFLLNLLVGKVKSKSSIYQTAAWGYENQPDFLNQALLLESNLEPEAFLNTCKQIERKMGRRFSEKWKERIIDIDILFYGSEIINLENLEIPHPHLQNRRFVLQPLHDVAPDFIHPILNKSISNLLLDCEDELSVKKWLYFEEE